MGEARQRSCVLRAASFHLLQHPCELHALSGTARHSFALSALLTSTSPCPQHSQTPSELPELKLHLMLLSPCPDVLGSQVPSPHTPPKHNHPKWQLYPWGGCIPWADPRGSCTPVLWAVPRQLSLSGSTTHRFNLSQNIFLITAREKHLFTIQEY